MKLTYTICLLMLLMVHLPSCGYVNKKERITRRWRVTHVEQISAEDSVRSTPLSYQFIFELRDKQRYLLSIGDRRDSGTWQLTQDERVLVLRSEVSAKDNEEFVIEELNRYQLILSLESKNLPKERLKLEPAP